MSLALRPIGRRARLAVVALLPVLVAACQSPTAARMGVRVLGTHRGGGVLEVTNATAAPVFVQVLGARTAPLALWGPCVDATVCEPIAPGTSREVSVRLTAPDGTPETEALLYWWHVERGADGALRPDSIRTVVVRL
jgi:hypothetical protein